MALDGPQGAPTDMSELTYRSLGRDEANWSGRAYVASDLPCSQRTVVHGVGGRDETATRDFTFKSLPSGIEPGAPMPKRILACAVTVLTAGCAGSEAGLPQSGNELATQVADAAGAEELESLLALVKWDGVSDQLRESLERSIRSLPEYGVASVEIEALPDGYRDRRVRNGIEYRPNVEVEGLLRVRFGSGGPAGSESIAMPFGRDSEGYRIAGTIEVPIEGASAENDVSVNIIVVGGGASEPVRFEGSCRVMRSGAEVTESFEGTGNLTSAVWGESVRGCEVRRTSQAGWIELRLSVGGERVFSSPRTESSDPIVFEAGPGGA